jgi:plastocyanin domain-containing protein
MKVSHLHKIFISKRYTQIIKGGIIKMITINLKKIVIIAAALLIVLATMVYLGKGSLLSGTASAADKASIEGNQQLINSELSSSGYPQLIVQKGVPVRWVLTADASTLSSCNNVLVIPAYGIEKKLEPGKNVIEFTPIESGTIPFSCWMGMINSQITVVDDLANIDQLALNNQAAAAGATSGGNCCSARTTTN